jgi:prolipoprotein diacylglyceryltransferase
MQIIMSFLDSLHPFSLILALGACFALLRVVFSSPSAQQLDWAVAALLCLSGIFIGARLAYVLEHFHYYSIHTDEIIRFWQGGLSWIGTIAGALLILPLVQRLWQWKFWNIADRLSLMVLPLSLSIWLACLVEGSAYGALLPQGTWWGLKVLDETGTQLLRIPLQPLAAFSLLVFLGLAEGLLKKSTRPGLAFSVLMLIFSADMLLFTFMRADPAQSWLGIRIESWAALIYTFCAILSTITILGVPQRFFSIRWFKKKSVSESKAL